MVAEYFLRAASEPQWTRWGLSPGPSASWHHVQGQAPDGDKIPRLPQALAQSGHRKIVAASSQDRATEALRRPRRASQLHALNPKADATGPQRAQRATTAAAQLTTARLLSARPATLGRQGAHGLAAKLCPVRSQSLRLKSRRLRLSLSAPTSCCCCSAPTSCCCCCCFS